MIRSTALATLLLAATAAFAAEGTFDKTLTVSGTPTISISTGSGHVHVTPGSDTQVHIVGHVRSNTSWFGGDADAKVKEIVANPPIVQSGNIVTVGKSNGDWSQYRNITIDYDVTIPRTSSLKAGTGSGEVNVSSIQGAVNASSGSGDVHVDNLGPNSRIGTGSGSIRASNIHGATALETGSGDIELQETAAGDVRASTGSGSIRLQGISGGLRAGTGSGDIEIAGIPTSDWKLDTGSGSLRLNLGSAAKFNLNADTGSGSVRIDQPVTMQGAINRHHVSGTVNGGGANIKAVTGSGDITIR